MPDPIKFSFFLYHNAVRMALRLLAYVNGPCCLRTPFISHMEVRIREPRNIVELKRSGLYTNPFLLFKEAYSYKGIESSRGE